MKCRKVTDVHNKIKMGKMLEKLLFSFFPYSLHSTSFFGGRVVSKQFKRKLGYIKCCCRRRGAGKAGKRSIQPLTEIQLSNEYLNFF